MDTQRAREIAIVQAVRLAESDHLPTCSGCPPGVFEGSIDRWLTKLANLMRRATTLHWAVASVGAPPFMFVLQADQHGIDPPRLEVPIARIDTFGDGRKKLVILESEGTEIEPGVVPPVAADRDRVGEILEQLALLTREVQDLRQQVRTRDIAHLERVQRLMLLVHHFGNAAWVGSVKVLGREWPVVVQRPGPGKTEPPA